VFLFLGFFCGFSSLVLRANALVAEERGRKGERRRSERELPARRKLPRGRETLFSLFF
jgi:hypothetical protein